MNCGMLETGIVEGEPFSASLDLVLNASTFFQLPLADAKRSAHLMAVLIADNWKQALKDEGVTPDEIRSYASAFEHEEAFKARSLLG